MPTFEPTIPENTTVSFQAGSSDSAGRITIATQGFVDESVLGKFIFDTPKTNYVATISGRLNGADEILGSMDSEGFYIGAPDDTVSLRENLYSIKYHVDDLVTE